jgi:hypothetical protein
VRAIEQISSGQIGHPAGLYYRKQSGPFLWLAWDRVVRCDADYGVASGSLSDATSACADIRTMRSEVRNGVHRTCGQLCGQPAARRGHKHGAPATDCSKVEQKKC